MGYKRDKLYRLVFEDPEFAAPESGEPLEVRTKPVPIGVYLRMKRLLVEAITQESLEELFGEFAKILHSWNLEDDDDQPVPTTYEGLWSCDLEFVKAIIRAWSRAMTQLTEVDDPLPQASDDGELSVEASIPMETLSSSQAS